MTSEDEGKLRYDQKLRCDQDLYRRLVKPTKLQRIWPGHWIEKQH
jgi:hypothetical protein